MKYLFSLNKLVCFGLSAAMSFLFYSSLAGSNMFFWWFNGILAVCFDITRYELWQSNKRHCRIMAWFFIAFSIVAFSGVSLSETLRATVTEVDEQYILSLESDIAQLDVLIENQTQRIANTSADYGTAAQKENSILTELREDKDIKQKELRDYKQLHKVDESASSFDIYADFFGIKISQFMLVFFIIRAILLEVAILTNTKVKVEEKIIERVVEKIVEKNIDLGTPIETDETKRLLAIWRKSSLDKGVKQNVEAMDKIKLIIDKYDALTNQSTET